MASNKGKYLAVIYNDFAINLLAVVNGDFDKGLTYQIPLEPGIVSNSLIVDENEFFHLLKDAFKKMKIKKYTVRVMAPSQAAVMKKVLLPDELTEADEIKTYVEAEVNNTIRLPFEDALIDVYDEDVTDGAALLFATEKNEVEKLLDIFQDLGMYVDAVDIKTLADLRILEQVSPSFEQSTTLVLDWSINELLISIVEKGQVELLRAHPIKTNIGEWLVTDDDGIIDYELKEDNTTYKNELEASLIEIDKVAHFYQFSLNKGSKEIQKVINIGDHPMLADIAKLLKDVIPLNVTELTDEEIDSKFPTYLVKHCSLLGLVTKEVGGQ